MLRTNRGQGPMGKIPRNLGKYMLFTWHAPQRLRPRAFLQAHIHRGIVPSCNEIYSPRWLISIHTVQGYLGKSPARWGFFFTYFFHRSKKSPTHVAFRKLVDYWRFWWNPGVSKTPFSRHLDRSISAYLKGILLPLGAVNIIALNTISNPISF